MNISVKTFANSDRESAIKANATLTIDNAFVVKNLTVVQGKNGLFVNMPHHKTNEVDENGKAVYRDDAFPLSKDVRDVIQKAAIESYEKGGQEVEASFDTPSKSSVKQGPAKEDARLDEGAGKPSVLKILKEEPLKGTDKPIKITMEEPKKSKGKDAR